MVYIYCLLLSNLNYADADTLRAILFHISQPYSSYRGAQLATVNKYRDKINGFLKNLSYKPTTKFNKEIIEGVCKIISSLVGNTKETKIRAQYAGLLAKKLSVGSLESAYHIIRNEYASSQVKTLSAEDEGYVRRINIAHPNISSLSQEEKIAALEAVVFEAKKRAYRAANASKGEARIEKALSDLEDEYRQEARRYALENVDRLLPSSGSSIVNTSSSAVISVSAGGGGERSVAGDSAGNGGSVVGVKDRMAQLAASSTGDEKTETERAAIKAKVLKGAQGGSGDALAGFVVGGGAAPKPEPKAVVPGGVPAAGGGGMGGGLLGAIQGGAKPKKKKDPNAQARNEEKTAKRNQLLLQNKEYSEIQAALALIDEKYDALMG